MPERLRKLIGTFVLVGFIIVYALSVMTIAAAKLPGMSGWVQFAFYFVGGLVWVLPAGLIIAWMVRPRARNRA